MPVEASLIIPTFNRSATLLRVLRALEAQTHDRQAFEVLVVDDGSQDDTPSAVAQHTAGSGLAVRHLRQENRGPAAARNRGIAASRGSLLVLLGDDTIPAPEFLAEHVRYHREHAGQAKLAVVGHTVWPPEMSVTPFMRFAGEGGPQFAYRQMPPGVALSHWYFYSSNVSFPRTLLDAVDHAFDEEFTEAMWEDTELGYRLAGQGMQLHYHPGAVAYHDHPTTLAQSCRRARRVGAVSRLLVRKHPELRGDFCRHARLKRLLGLAAAPLLPLADALDRRLRLPLPELLYRALLAAHRAQGAGSTAAAGGGLPVC